MSSPKSKLKSAFDFAVSVVKAPYSTKRAFTTVAVAAVPFAVFAALNATGYGLAEPASAVKLGLTTLGALAGLGVISKAAHGAEEVAGMKEKVGAESFPETGKLRGLKIVFNMAREALADPYTTKQIPLNIGIGAAIGAYMYATADSSYTGSLLGSVGFMAVTTPILMKALGGTGAAMDKRYGYKPSPVTL